MILKFYSTEYGETSTQQETCFSHLIRTVCKQKHYKPYPYGIKIPLSVSMQKEEKSTSLFS